MTEAFQRRPYDFYFRHCYEMAARSLDPRTRVGCCIAEESEGLVVAGGWNSLPRNVRPLPERTDADFKRNWMLLAAQAAVCNAASLGQPTFGMTAFITWWPDADSAKVLVECQVAKLVVHTPPGRKDRTDWGRQILIGQAMLAEAGLEVVAYKEPVGCEVLFDGELVQV